MMQRSVLSDNCLVFSVDRLVHMTADTEREWWGKQNKTHKENKTCKLYRMYV